MIEDSFFPVFYVHYIRIVYSKKDILMSLLLPIFMELLLTQIILWGFFPPYAHMIEKLSTNLKVVMNIHVLLPYNTKQNTNRVSNLSLKMRLHSQSR